MFMLWLGIHVNIFGDCVLDIMLSLMNYVTTFENDLRNILWLNDKWEKQLASIYTVSLSIWNLRIQDTCTR